MDDNLSDRGAERGVLSAVCQFGSSAYLECSELLTGQSFTVQLNTVLYDVFEHIYKKDLNIKLDLAVISSASKEVGLYQELSSELKYIDSLFKFHIELPNVRPLAIKLRKLYEARELLGKVDETAAAIRGITGNESIGEIRAIAEKPIFEFSNKLVIGANQIEHIATGLDDYLEGLKETDQRGVSIGFPKFEMAVGWLTSGVHIIGAFLKTGKSFVGQNAALNCAGKTKTPVLLIDTELDPAQGVWDRLLSRLTQIDSNDIRFGSYKRDDKQIELIRRAALTIKRMPLDYVNITGKEWDECIGLIRRWLLTKVGYDNTGKLNKCLVILDYIKLTDSKSINNNISEHQELGFRLESLHSLCKQYTFPVLAFAQLNREQEIASSLRLQWFCTSYSQMSRKQQEEIGEDGPQNGNLKIQPQYCRSGPGMDDRDYICYNFVGKYARIEELKTYKEILQERDVRP